MGSEPNVSDNRERSLWAAVLLRQVDDALVGPGDTPKNERLLLIRQARSFLTSPSQDLVIVCANAGMDMRAVIKRMTKLIDQAPTPEELISKRASRATLHKRTIIPAQALDQQREAA